MEIDGYRAIVQFDPDIEMFRGEFVGLNGGADFYGPRRFRSQEGRRGIAQGVLEMCEETASSPDAGTRGGSTCASRPSCTRTSPPPPPPKGRV